MATTTQVSTDSQNIPRQGGQFGVQAAGFLLVLAVLLGAVYWKILRALSIQWWDDAKENRQDEEETGRWNPEPTASARDLLTFA